MNPRANISYKSYAHGMTLVEVLIAAVVIAVGLLGIASLQINSIQSASDAQYRSKATDLIASLADRIRANVSAVDAYGPPNAIPADSCALAPNATMATIERCAMSPDGTAAVVTACSTAEMAAYDLWEINCELQSTIPGAQLSITCPGGACAPMDEMTVTVTWQVQNRNPDGGAATPANFTTHEVVATILPGV
jgi:type IV pilus assembly protein PilV